MIVGPNMSERELFVVLGQEVVSTSKMGTQVTEQQKFNLGRQWLENHLEQIKSAVCSQNVVKDLAEKADTAALVTAIAPMLAFSATATSVAVVSALIIRVGVRQLCSGQWKPSNAAH